MAKAKTLTISGPFDARHVSGANIPGVTMPIRDFTFEPDSDDEKENQKPRDVEAPKRSNTFSQSLRQPSLRLRSSISRLRSRSSSISRSASRDGLRDGAGEGSEKASAHQRMHSSHRANTHSALPPPPPPPPPHDHSPLRSTSRSISHSNLRSAFRSNSPLKTSQSLSQPQSNVINRPKRADSGTAIDFSDTPAEERPLGFKEILKVESFEERMALYKRTREYWATADHGLGEWVGRVGNARGVV
ncbi:hypothetical protein P154DRAFT_619394 [Amniculicola lignicola CBS 123094]|uniref:Uncharacterized protein n=1 Tax=Amniculicola lignicola CBS 123094 TaxID=1392246 RepID=A0A6A5WMH9_9PLEO|nr:hypothetical protein P154DRAFT_619394 [Amniculicola lignicola CBS 123094]